MLLGLEGKIVFLFIGTQNLKKLNGGDILKEKKQHGRLLKI